MRNPTAETTQYPPHLRREEGMPTSVRNGGILWGDGWVWVATCIQEPDLFFDLCEDLALGSCVYSAGRMGPGRRSGSCEGSRAGRVSGCVEWFYIPLVVLLGEAFLGSFLCCSKSLLATHHLLLHAVLWFQSEAVLSHPGRRPGSINRSSFQPETACPKVIWGSNLLNPRPSRNLISSVNQGNHVQEGPRSSRAEPRSTSG